MTMCRGTPNSSILSISRGKADLAAARGEGEQQGLLDGPEQVEEVHPPDERGPAQEEDRKTTRPP